MKNVIDTRRDMDKICNIELDKLKILPAKKVLNIFEPAGKEVIEADDFNILADEAVAKVGS